MTCVLCGAGPNAEDSYNVCDECGMKIARRYKERLLWEERQAEREHDEKRRAAEFERLRREEASKPPLPKREEQDEPVVYYVRIGDVIKIGYSTNLRARLHQLRVELHNLLAIEPGGQQREHERHQQFAHLRVKAKWENFIPGSDLEQHISTLRGLHGIPVWLTPPRINRRGRNSPVVVRQRDNA